MEQYQKEKRELLARDGQIHAEIWGLGKLRGMDSRIFALQQELAANRARIRTLEYLMQHDVPDTAGSSRGPGSPRSSSRRSAPAAETGP